MPRPRNNGAIGGGLGAAVGALLGGPVGAGIGGMLGAALLEEAAPLARSVEELLTNRGLTLVTLDRPSKVSIAASFKDSSGGYWTVQTRVDPQGLDTPEQLDDALYDALVKELNAWRRAPA